MSTGRGPMDKGRFSDKIKEGISVNEIEGFANKHTTEAFSMIALIIAAISSSFDFFTGPRFALLFLVIGTLVSIIFPLQIERGLKQFYAFTFKQEKMTEIIFGIVKIVVALFIPFLYFGFVGLLAGASYHYFIRHGQIAKANEPKQARKVVAEDEHD